jgi:hypothetical protein
MKIDKINVYIGDSGNWRQRTYYLREPKGLAPPENTEITFEEAMRRLQEKREDINSVREKQTW